MSGGHKVEPTNTISLPILTSTAGDGFLLFPVWLEACLRTHGATRPRRARTAVLGSAPFLPFPPCVACPASSRARAGLPRLQISDFRRRSAPAKLSLAVMRWRLGALLVLLAVFSVVAVAEDTVPAETNSDSSKAHSGVEKLGQPDETNLKEEVVHREGGLKNDTGGNNKNDTSTEGTGGKRDEPPQKLREKDSKETKSSQTTDLLQEDPLIAECDLSHRCIIEQSKFIACLKVPGEDSLDSLALSLLMGNKGMNPLDVSITAPDYVTLGENIVRIEANGHNETQVRVSVSDAANDTAIVVKVAEGNCTINIHRAIARETGPVMRMRLTLTYMLVPIFFLLAVVVVCIKLKRTRKQDGGLAYQKLDTAAELPVSMGAKKDSDQPVKWDDNWGDDWDDEEAPLTASKPMPNPSSKGLAVRRLAKDGWKD